MKRRGVIIYTLVGAIGLAFIIWQVVEHRRVVEAGRHTLMSRGRAITSTLGLLIRSQRRWGVISQERLESVLAELIKPGDVESIALLNAENDVVVAAGAPGVELLSEDARKGADSLRVAIDLNAVPPVGIGGIAVHDKAIERERCICYGAVGVGGTKMKIHKAALRSLFEANDRVLDTDAIYEIGREIA